MEPFTLHECGLNAARAPLWLVKHRRPCKKVLWDIAFNAHLHPHRVKRIPLRECALNISVGTGITRAVWKGPMGTFIHDVKYCRNMCFTEYNQSIIHACLIESPKCGSLILRKMTLWSQNHGDLIGVCQPRPPLPHSLFKPNLGCILPLVAFFKVENMIIRCILNQSSCTGEGKLWLFSLPPSLYTFVFIVMFNLLNFPIFILILRCAVLKHYNLFC